MNIFCLRNDGSWARFQSEEGAEPGRLAAYRGYYESNAPAASAAPNRAAPLPGTYKTLFQNGDQQGATTGESVTYDNLDYEGTIPYAGSSTGIQPTLRTIDADGTSRVFDMQGRQLNGKPDKGLYIIDGRKIVK